jgi:hypothetical protein
MTDKNKDSIEPMQQRTMTFLTCPRHNVSYPKGSSCPQCIAESKQKGK